MMEAMSRGLGSSKGLREQVGRDYGVEDGDTDVQRVEKSDRFFGRW